MSGPEFLNIGVMERILFHQCTPVAELNIEAYLEPWKTSKIDCFTKKV